jgi:hypothetical protein
VGSCARVCICWRWVGVVRGGGEWWYGQRWWWVGLLGRRRGGDVLTLGDLGIIFCGLRGRVVFCRRVIGRSFARGCQCHVVPERLASYAAARSRAGSSGHRTCRSHSATTTCPTTPPHLRWPGQCGADFSSRSLELDSSVHSASLIHSLQIPPSSSPQRVLYHPFRA